MCKLSPKLPQRQASFPSQNLYGGIPLSCRLQCSDTVLARDTFKSWNGTTSKSKIRILGYDFGEVQLHHNDDDAGFFIVETAQPGIV